MRPIKFRAWDRRNTIMRLWDALRGLDYHKQFELFDDENFIFQQFTGLHDKNGKEIYQGDILKVVADKEGYGFCSYGGIIKVVAHTCGYELKPIKPTFEEMEERGEAWDSSSLWHVCEKGTNGEGTTEVIGNIYENPELIK